MSIFSFFYTLQTNQIVRLSHNHKTIQGAAFRVFNTCLDINIENDVIEKIEIKDNMIFIYA